ncbi:AraC family transcriptional regulator [Sansalvadorimonas sp. 2012CJ34-2]|uniref:AraC family transcriptional regulator n=1 Tax=Parendozoicomonas callyspongiae TaxID=2942213 RepID=A0ABT0PCN7_9GAMM|nr:AraC family transcriptional regulator [Sansalvadorimonas sp. 2012CJ34-2]MCL6269139.1 AraC family transcriptional regulator [Sansalvadorimonas sp. 2012CJ34-2]
MKNIKRNIAIPITYIRHLMVLIRENGLRDDTFLMAAGIRPEELSRDEGTIDFERCDRLITLLRQQCKIQSLGWQLGQRLHLPSHGVLSVAALTSKTIKDMLEMSVRYMATRFPLMVVFLDTDGEEAVMQFDEALDLGENRRFYVEAFIASHQVMRFYSFGPDACVGHKLHLAISKKDYYDDFDFGDVEVSYNHAAHQFRFPAYYLQMPMPMADTITQQSAERQCRKILEDMKVETGLLGRVLSFIRSREGVIPSLEQTADYLLISPRTLRRQLQELDITYRTLVNRERKRLALHYLRNTRLTVEEIAERLDYNDPSNFGRAFRKWTGHSPGYYRHTVTELET